MLDTVGIEVVLIAGVDEDVEVAGPVVVVLGSSLFEVKCTTVGIVMRQIRERIKATRKIFLFLFTADNNLSSGFLTL